MRSCGRRAERSPPAFTCCSSICSHRVRATRKGFTAVWGDECDADYALGEEKPLTCGAFVAGAAAKNFIESVAIGDALPDMPLFLTPERYVPVLLEATYQLAWEGMPAYWRKVLAYELEPRDRS